MGGAERGVFRILPKLKISLSDLPKIKLKLNVDTPTGMVFSSRPEPSSGSHLTDIFCRS